MLYRTLVVSVLVVVLASGASYAGFEKIFTFPEGGSALDKDIYMMAQNTLSDFDGDGLADIFAKTGSTEISIYSIANPNHTPEILWSYAPNISSDGIAVQGAVDIFPAQGKEVLYEWYSYDDGNSFHIVGADGALIFGFPGGNFQYFADFDGDGLAEVVVEIGGGLEIWGYVPDTVSVEGILPGAAHLNQNYPNPFNPSTNIQFQLSEPGLTTVNVYDISGRKVWSRDLGQLMPGGHQVVWNGCDERDNPVASGSYLYQLCSGTWTSQKKMLLIK